MFHALVDVGSAEFEHAIEQSGQLVGHGGNGFRGTETRAQAAELRAQHALTADQIPGTDAQGSGRAVDDPASPSFQDLAATDSIVWTQSQPGSKVTLRWLLLIYFARPLSRRYNAWTTSLRERHPDFNPPPTPEWRARNTKIMTVVFRVAGLFLILLSLLTFFQRIGSVAKRQLEFKTAHYRTRIESRLR